jgi:hypothetical protein
VVVFEGFIMADVDYRKTLLEEFSFEVTREGAVAVREALDGLIDSGEADSDGEALSKLATWAVETPERIERIAVPPASTRGEAIVKIARAWLEERRLSLN